MLKGKARAIVSALIALMFVLQVAPSYVFAEGDATAGAEVSSEAQSSAEESNETDLNYAIDSEGNMVDLPDDYGSTILDADVMTETEDSEASGALVDNSSSVTEFYAIDEDVHLADESLATVFNIDFEDQTVGATEVDGWDFAISSKSGNQSTSTIQIAEDPERGKVLQLQKNLNGASNGSFAAGDDTLLAQYVFPDTAEYGNFEVSADLKVTKAGRMGIYLFGADGVELLDPPVVDFVTRSYFWDNGGESVDPTTTTIEGQGIQNWDGASKDDKDSKYYMSSNEWYTFKVIVDTNAGTYTLVVYNPDGTEKRRSSNLALNTDNLGDPAEIYGVGFEVMNDVKSLGTLLVDNVKLVDNNDFRGEMVSVGQDKDQLALPSGVDANNVTENFTMPVMGSNGSAITWSSDNTDIVSIDANGNVTVTRPAYTGAGSYTVRITASLSKGNAAATKSFVLTVPENAPTTDAEKVAADAAQVALPADLDTDNVGSAFKLQTAGENGSTVSWTSSDPSVISIDAEGNATVTNPSYAGEDSVGIDLTATVSFGGASQEVTFRVFVTARDPETDEEKIQYDISKLLIGGVDLTNIRQSSIYLPEKGSKFTTITWTSSDEDYVKIEKNYESDIEVDDEGNVSEGVATEAEGYQAVITRPDKNSNAANVTLTAHLSIGSVTLTKDFALTIQPEDALKAYPGVEGYGAYSEGGRGGQVYHVTNLNSYGPGSLTYGLEEVQGPRTIVFDVGGVIDLSDLGREISIKGEKCSNVTVAGQTAPYPGITLKGYGLTVSAAHDVIIRHIKIRIGDVKADNELYQSDPLSIGNSTNVIIDHCSLQWAIDMAFRATGEYITLSNTIFGKSLLQNSPHEKGGHAYIGMINEGAKKVSFVKNFVGDSTQRSPRITDADWIDAYNNLLYNCGNGFDLYNYEWMNRNSKMNVHGNYARKGPSLSNGTPYRMGRGREYAGGVMCYFEDNYGSGGSESLQETATQNSSGPKFKKILTFGETNGSAGTDYDLSNVTLTEWDENPVSYDNNNKTSPGATFTYMTYPFPAPRGEVLSGSKSSIMDYALDENNGMGATKPSRDLYDTMIMKEAEGGTATKATLSKEEVTPFFEQLEYHTGLDYSEYKTSRTWTVRQGDGPVLKGAGTSSGETKPVDWDNYTDVKNNSSKYSYTTNFEVGDWWGEYTGAAGQETIYTLYDNKLGRTVTTTNGDYDETRYSLISMEDMYIASKRTVADLYPSDWVYEDFPDVAEFMDKYRKSNYPEPAEDASEEEWKAYMSTEIVWDSMGDGIADWYKEYKGWNKKQFCANLIDEETGYTYIEDFLAFMAGDQPLATDDTPATVENFKVNNLGYSTAQVYWNTDYRTTCVIEYGTEPGVYTNSEALQYDSSTDYYHTYHAITLVDLEPNTTYYYKVTAVDENSNTTVAEYNANGNSTEKSMTFTTTEAPEGAADILPSKPTITNTVPYVNQVRLNWTGDVATDESYSIYYDTTSHGGDIDAYAYNVSGLDVRTDSQIVTELENNIPYYFIVVAVNKNGQTASDEIEVVPSGTIFNYTFNDMTAEERESYMQNEYIYDLGGKGSMQKDPDTGEWVLQLLDETNSHGVNTHLKLPVTQEEKFTFEVKLKVLYQKQTDALNRQEDVDGDGSDEHNTVQLNFFKDSIMNDEKDSTISALWDNVFSLFFNSSSTPISENNGRYDGTVETGSFEYNSTPISTYKSGTTVKGAGNSNAVLPSGTGYSSSTYRYTSVYGDAKFSKQEDTDKTLHGIWYYEKGSADFITVRLVIDPLNNNVQVYKDDELIYQVGTFSEDVEEPYNIGKIEIKSRNDGYSWVNVASIRAFVGDGTSDTPITPVPPTIAGGGGTGGGNGGGIGGGGDTTATASPAPEVTADPEATATPEATPAATTEFTDMVGYEWAVEAVKSLAEKGIVTGIGNGQFAPADQVTRAEFVTMLMRAFGQDVTASGEEASEFSDVADNEWYTDKICKAVSLGIVQGNGDGTFGVNDPISRQDMMVMSYRTLNTFGVTVDKVKEYTDFIDQNDIADYAVEAVKEMYCAGIINGVGDGMLDPTGVAERAQAAKVIYGLI